VVEVVEVLLLTHLVELVVVVQVEVVLLQVVLLVQ
tara:strand:+ start:577 stop:681 length:105 start_codon:yes stop_codon:yes gene_type:complete